MKNNIYRWLLCGCFLMISINLLEAQVRVKRKRAVVEKEYNNDKYNAILVNLTYGFQIPGGDLADRFGNNHSFGLGTEFMLKNSNIFIGAQYNFMFGNQVKENVVSTLTSTNGQILGLDGTYADVVLRERGFQVSGTIGKLFQFNKKKRMGIRTSLSLGLLQHKVRIQDNTNSAGGLLDDYVKGYDRLTNGLSVTEFIGFQVLGEQRLINFFAGFEFTQAFTKNRRDYNFDQMAQDNTNRTDLIMGFRVGWTLPFYLEDFGEEIFY